MSKIKEILGEDSVEEFEEKCNEVLTMISSEEYDLTEEKLDIFKEVYTIFVMNGGHEIINKIVRDLGGLTDDNTDEYSDRINLAVKKWIEEIL